jgi:hypothetical protein
VIFFDTSCHRINFYARPAPKSSVEKYSSNHAFTSDAVEALFSSVIFAATDLAHSRVAKIIATRHTRHSELKLRDFYAFHEEIWAFIMSCGNICKKKVVTLRGVVGGQVSH